jgi:hypothetical protein
MAEYTATCIQCDDGKPVYYEPESPAIAVSQSTPDLSQAIVPVKPKQIAPTIGMYSTLAGMSASVVYALLTKSYGYMVVSLAGGGVMLYLLNKYQATQ